MANILEFLRGVLTDDESQRLFRGDPEGFVTRAGFDDLTGEDVVEAIVVLRRSLLPEVSSVLVDFEDETKLPPVRPAFDERELDAALRQLHHAVDLTTGATAAGTSAPEPVEEQPPTPSAEPAQAEEEAPTVHDEPIEVEVEPELAEPAPEPAPATEPAGAPPRPKRDRPAGRSDIESVQAFGDALTTAANDVRSLLEEYAEEVLERMSSTVEAAERDATAIRGEAEADRETARKVLLDARAEADRIRAEAEQTRADVEARREELREAERELRERLSGLDAVFRTVLKDD